MTYRQGVSLRNHDVILGEMIAKNLSAGHLNVFGCGDPFNQRDDCKTMKKSNAT